jgi:Zn-dependent peptidase ImmA (M78 family)
VQENEANEFAAELLMPESFLRADLPQYGLDVPALAKRYRVSEQAMWIQLMDLELANQYSQA